jgi:hypothetical protein
MDTKGNGITHDPNDSLKEAAMSIKKTLIALTLAGAALAPLASQAAVAVGVDINIGPPAQRVIVAPAPRPGYVYAPGYWQWNGHRHVWIDGRYLHARDGYHWRADHWVQRGPNWHYEPGHWSPDRHDRDHGPDNHGPHRG